MQVKIASALPSQLYSSVAVDTAEAAPKVVIKKLDRNVIDSLMTTP
jgi:hypothetical protein